ncbi:phosphotransferase [uncultured Amaricoccus sp.]|uniref:phosphotransferase enzyme family protein n=1 Tax=uncultured Amaricoccus sp. TaxID=339341 RepID=UPI0026121C51|nr:phosphotransferase [uncultured Amaricoccus sp.]
MTETPLPDDSLAAMTRAADEAMMTWGFAGADRSLVKFRENAVFRVTGPDGRRRALRVHRPGYHSDAELASELAWMEALAADGLPVPAVVPTPGGALMATIGEPGSAFQVDVLEWLDGAPIGSAGESMRLAGPDLARVQAETGRLAARIHAHAATWARPAGFTRHAWDCDGLIGPTPFWGPFRALPAIAEHLALVDAVCERARADLAAFGTTPDNYGLIHADLVPDNLLEAGGAVMLIDFDDAGFGWHLFEIATALFFLQGTEGFEAARDNLVAGYRSVRPLPEADLARLDLFLALRGLTYLSWLASRQDTETARELAPVLVGLAVRACRAYLDADA